MFKIGEFSKLTQVSVRMLRYYDENNILHPAMTNEETGYRMYTIEQIDLLNKIVFLRDMGFNINEIASFIQNWNDDSMKDWLNKKQLEIEEKIQAEQIKLARIKSALSDIENEQILINTGVVIKEIPAYRVISFRKIIDNYFLEEMLWRELTLRLKGNNIPIDEDSACFSIYHDNEYKESNVDVEVCMIVENNISTGLETYLSNINVDGISCYNTKAYRYAASFMIKGPYENISKSYIQFAKWLSKHPQYSMIGESRQICHIGSWNEKNSENFLTELLVPIKINTKQA